jgi:hypothetical protein
MDGSLRLDDLDRDELLVLAREQLFSVKDLLWARWKVLNARAEAAHDQLQALYAHRHDAFQLSTAAKSASARSKAWADHRRICRLEKRADATYDQIIVMRKGE